jgi:hypothetical protein
MTDTGCRITKSWSYVTVRGERTIERTRGNKTAKRDLRIYSITENNFSFNF